MKQVKKVVPVYLLKAEHEKFKELCKKDGLTMSSVLRSLAIAKISKAKRGSEA